MNYPRCPYEKLAPDSFSGGPVVLCDGVAFPGGWVKNSCGEPCSFVMHPPQVDECPFHIRQSVWNKLSHIAGWEAHYNAIGLDTSGWYRSIV